MFKLVEDTSGQGELSRNGAVLHRVTYRLCRFQRQLGEGGLPVPGAYRLEGSLGFRDGVGAPPELIGEPLTLRLDDGRVVSVTLVAADGRILTEGHHPRGCSCC
jgi:hypothetical protein